MERWRLMLLGNPQMMEQMRRVRSAVTLPENRVALTILTHLE